MKSSGRNNGCLIQKQRCPCGDEQCHIKPNSDEDEASAEPAVHMETNLTQGTNRTAALTSEDATVNSPYTGQCFRTDGEAQEYYTNFARKNGFAIRRERSKGNSLHPLGVYKRELVCHRAGASLPRKTAELKRQRNKKSSRCKCEAQMIIKKNVSKGATQWMVVHFSNNHNHELLGSEEVRHLPAYRNIPLIVRERILCLAKTGCTVNAIMRALEMDKGEKSSQLSFTERDLRNFLQASKNIHRENEGLELLKACKVVKEKNLEFRYEYTLDKNDALEHITWSYPDAIRAYKVFGDVVIFDTTYRLYAYDRPVGVWFGMDNYGSLIFFGCVLLQDEKPASFKWAMESFIRLMDGKFPQTVLTDLDMGLQEVMINVLPNTKHAFGVWYIISKLSSWFSSQLGPRYETFVSEFCRIYCLDNETEFVHQWGQMINEFGVGSDRHVAILSLYRTYWALPYLRGWFFARLTTTEILAPIKSFFTGFLNSQTRLKDFVEQVASAIELQNQAGEEATMKQNYQNVKIKTCMPIEEQVSTVLAPYAFHMFQEELVSSVQFAVYESQRETYVVRHRLKTDSGYLVQFFPSEEEIRCSCKEFESSGILCCHALRVLSLKNFFLLPDKYLLTRWRRESSLFPKSTGYRYRSQVLRSLATIIIQESAQTKERFDYVQWHLSKLLTHVRDMPTVEEVPSDAEPAASLNVAVDVCPVRSRGRSKKTKASNETPKEATDPSQVQILPEPEETSGAQELL